MALKVPVEEPSTASEADILFSHSTASSSVRFIGNYDGVTVDLVLCFAFEIAGITALVRLLLQEVPLVRLTIAQA